LLEGLRPGRARRHRRVEQQVRINDLVDRLRDNLHIAAVHGFVEAAERRFVRCYLGC
jgi:predicted nucleic acid-binding OB-fold protein